MKRLTDRKIYIIKRDTTLESIIKRYNTIQQAKFYIESIGGTFDDYVQEHDTYQQSVQRLYEQLDAIGYVQVLDRNYVPNCVFGPEDIVTVIGQDGMVVNTMKYLEDQPLIGINPDCERWDGILLPFQVEEVKEVTMDVIRNKHTVDQVSMARVDLNDGRSLHAVNDFYIGSKSHVSSRYHITINNQSENQSSSGIIVSTGMGSTGWMASVLTGAGGVQGYMTKNPVDWSTRYQLPWDSRTLLYAVREPFPSKRTKVGLTFGKVEADEAFNIQSHMPEDGVIFSDGIESDYLEFTAGMTASITIASQKGHLVRKR